jgi:hypothetical protein
LVSFNGRGFDRPVLQNRAMINRTLLDLDHKHHLDLLHLCRRLFRPRTSDCRLGTMEREVLGFDRVGDLPGSEAPRIYNLWLRTGASAELSQLLEHNRLDVALMAPLLTVTTQHAVDPLHWSEDAEELLAAALMHLKGDGESLELAEACLRRGLELAWIPATRRLLLSTLARHLRRTHRPHEASALWEQLRLEFPNHITGWIELAKYHEHVTGDLPRALELAEQSPQQQEGAIQHRLRRLRRRVERAQRSAQRRPRSAGQV